jgi:hypothetical protein
MRTSNGAAVLFACCGLAAVASSASAQVVMSQIYGGGGNANALVNADYVELKNNGLTPANIGGWSIQYAGATQATGFTARFDIPAGTVIPANSYFLIRLQNTGTNGAAPTLAYDLINDSVTGTLFLGATAGRVALVNNQVNVGTNCTASTIVDLVAYGASALCSETAPASGTANTTGLRRRNGGCTDNNNNSLDLEVINITVDTPRNSTVSANCPSPLDCNANGILDSVEISGNPALDCNSNGRLDECDINGGFFADCDANGQLDVCQITANSSLDCNNNGQLDSCESATGLFLDVNGADADNDDRVDFVLNSSDPDPANWRGGSAIGNGPLDAQCEGASVAAAIQVATVQPAGIRPGANGTNFWNIEGFNNGQFQSYGGTRFDIAAAVAAFNTQYGAGNWTIQDAYLVLQQSNAGFTRNGPVDIYWSNNDAQDFSVPSGTTPNTNTRYENFAADFADRELITPYTFYRGSRLSGAGDGTLEAFRIYSAGDTTPTAGQTAVGAELNGGSGQLTLVLLAPDFIGDATAATYAGTTNGAWRAPTLVLFAQQSGGGNPCDYDYNQDENVDLTDAQLMAQVAAGVINADPSWLSGDLNGDENADLTDAQQLAQFVASGVCPI